MKSRGALRGMFAGALALALAMVPTVSASADTTDGNWWYDYYDVGQAHAEGWTGKGVKITVIDEQINPDLPVFSGADVTVDKTEYCGAPPSTSEADEGSVHGTSVTALLVGNGTGAGAVKGIVPDASVTFEGYGGVDCGGSNGKAATGFGRAIKGAIDSGTDIITTSVGFGVASSSDIDILSDALAKGIIIVSAVPNRLNQDLSIPSEANGVVSVNAIGEDGTIQSHDDVTTINPEVTVVAAGVGIATNGDEQTGSWDSTYRAVGSSMATPLVAGMLAAAKQKYPKATANQLIQSLIHNTTADDHKLMRDETTGYGYGPASLNHLLAVDPSQYPDTNPLLDKSYAKPTAEQIASAGGGSDPTPTGSAESNGSNASDSSAATPIGLFIGIGVAVLVIVAAVVVLIVVLSRRRIPRGNGGNA
jgi:hypothetical protein